MTLSSGRPLFFTPLSEINAWHLDGLLRDGVRESRYLDYKAELYPWTDEGKVHLLKHVVGFANSGGGLLIFGVREVNELPVAIQGVAIDPARLRAIEVLIHEGIQPTLRDVGTRIVEHPNGSLLLLRIPMAFEPPHMVAYKSHHRFYSRFGSDTLPMTVHEIRRAFEETGSDMTSGFKLRQATAAPFNREFLIALHDAVRIGDHEGAQGLIIEYLRTANAELDGRESTLNSLFLTPTGELVTTPEAQDYALYLAKSNTYFKSALRALDRAIDSLNMLHTFLARTRDFSGLDEAGFASAELVQRKHQVDEEYAELVRLLASLVEALKNRRAWLGRPRRSPA